MAFLPFRQPAGAAWGGKGSRGAGGGSEKLLLLLQLLLVAVIVIVVVAPGFRPSST